MAGLKHSERHATHPLGTLSSGEAVSLLDLIALQDVSEETADNQVKVATLQDILGDALGTDAEGYNLFDKDDATAVTGAYLAANGAESANANYWITPYIPILPETNYAFYPATSNAAYTVFYNAAKEIISTKQNSSAPMPVYALSPANARYMRHSILLAAGAATISVVEGTSTPPSGLPLKVWKLSGYLFNPAKLTPNNVKRFGARGDGKTNDTAAFAAALTDTTIKSLYVPNGIYLLDGITINKTNCTSIIGESQFGAILQLNTALESPGSLITVEPGATANAIGAQLLTIENLTLKHKTNYTVTAGDHVSGAGINSRQNAYFMIRNVTFTAFSNHAIYINGVGTATAGAGAKDLNISDCLFCDCAMTLPSIYIGALSDYVSVVNNSFRATGGAIYVLNSGNVRFVNNKIVGCGSLTYAAVHLVGTYGGGAAGTKALVCSNTINHTTGDGIRAVGANVSGGLINGNMVLQPAAGCNGIVVLSVNHAIISNNRIIAPQAGCFDIIVGKDSGYGCGNIIVSNNCCEGNGLSDDDSCVTINDNNIFS